MNDGGSYSLLTTFTTRSLIRNFICVGISAAIGFTAMGFGGAGLAEAAPAKSKAERVIQTGKKFLGVRYRFGAPSGVTYAFDCSSFTQYIYKKVGVSLPRVSSQQAKRGAKVAKSRLKRGDLVFFKTPKRTGNAIGHVGVYLGGGKMLHSSPSGGGVNITSMRTSYWTKNYVTARRVIRS